MTTEELADLPAPPELLEDPPDRPPGRRGVDVLRRLERDGIIRILDIVDVDVLRAAAGIDHPLTAIRELTSRVLDHGTALKIVAANATPDVTGQVDRALLRLVEAVERLEQAATGEVSDRTRVAIDLLLSR